MGMGDYIIASGIVRYYANIHKNIVLFYKDPYKDKVKRLYADLDNITFLDGGTKEDHLAKSWVLLNPTKNLLKIRLERPLPSGSSLEEYFYNEARVPVEYKWKKFFFNRNKRRELEVYKDIGLSDDEKYIFVHDDSTVKTKLNTNLKIIRPDNMDIELFDYLLVMERAQEIHVMSSSFFCLIDCIQLDNDNLNFHEYVRNIPMGPSNLKWNIIK